MNIRVLNTTHYDTHQLGTIASTVLDESSGVSTVVFGYEPKSKEQMQARALESRCWRAPDPSTLLVVLLEPAKLVNVYQPAELLAFSGQNFTPPMFSAHVGYAMKSWYRWVDFKPEQLAQVPIRIQDSRQGADKDWQRAKAFVRLRAKMRDLDMMGKKLAKLQSTIERDTRIALQYATKVGVAAGEEVSSDLLFRRPG